MAASNSGVQLLEPKLKLQISAPLASAYFMASMTLSGEPLPSEPPKAFNTMIFTWVLSAMPACRCSEVVNSTGTMGSVTVFFPCADFIAV